MADESFLSCQTGSQLEATIDQFSFTSSRSFNDFISFQESHRDPPPSQSSSQSLPKKSQKKKLSRCKTALQWLSCGTSDQTQPTRFPNRSLAPLSGKAFACLRFTMCTIGYGDITPLTPITKVFACFFVLVGFGFIDILLSGLVNYVLDLQESMILAGLQMGASQSPQQQQQEQQGFSARNYVVDVAKGRMRIRLKVGLALGVVVLCIGIGSLVLYFVEDLDWIDSIYLSVMSVTTVGYGDKAFKTLPGRLFAAIWLLVSTLMVARAFLYLAEARIDKRHRRLAKSVLHRDITVEDLLAADINHTGFISKSEYVILKLKEMGKIREKDILQICDQFSKLDPNNSGKITLPSLLEGKAAFGNMGNQSREKKAETLHLCKNVTDM
ncbi:Two-pore potassium channel 5 [Senna tora]|uniref:Two-pore potassium channel 5 n=1 Tax=Senna tora TaxID=362788 RepID=A0A834TV02_9FABA|nr:Two-pore potassium channel 5 [Senna tora]